MEFKDVVLNRHSVRKYQEEMFPSGTLIDEIIELAGTAPSAGGLKAYEVFITKEKIIKQVDAPFYIVVCAWPDKSGSKYGERGQTLYSIQDATIFASYIQLLAVDVGLSTVWIGAFNENKIRETMGISKHLRPIAIIPIGYE